MINSAGSCKILKLTRERVDGWRGEGEKVDVEREGVEKVDVERERV